MSIESLNYGIPENEIVKYAFDIIMQHSYVSSCGYACEIYFKDIFDSDENFRYKYLKHPDKPTFITDAVKTYARNYYCTYVKYYIKKDVHGIPVAVAIYNPDGILPPDELLVVKSLQKTPTFRYENDSELVGPDPFNAKLQECITKYSSKSFDETAVLQRYYWNCNQIGSSSIYELFIIKLYFTLSENKSLAQAITYNYLYDDNIYTQNEKIYIKKTSPGTKFSNSAGDNIEIEIEPVRRFRSGADNTSIVLSDNYTVDPRLKLDERVNKLKAVFSMNGILPKLIQFLSKNMNNPKLFNLLSDDNVVFKYIKTDKLLLKDITFITKKAKKNNMSLCYYIKNEKKSLKEYNNNVLLANDFYYWLQVFFGESNRRESKAEAYDKNYERILLKDGYNIFNSIPELTYVEYMNYCDRYLPKILPLNFLDPRTKLKKFVSETNSIKYVSGETLSPEEYNREKSKIKLTLRELLDLKLIQQGFKPDDIWTNTYKSLSDANLIDPNKTDTIDQFGKDGNIAFIICIMRLIQIEKIDACANSFALGFFLLKICIFCKYDEDWTKYSDTFTYIIKKLLHPDYTKQMPAEESIKILERLL